MPDVGMASTRFVGIEQPSWETKMENSSNILRAAGVALKRSSFARRHFMASSSAALSVFSLAASAQSVTNNGVIAGAIRWDAWYSRADFSAYAQNDLGPEAFHYRAPLHCKVATSAVDCVGNQDEMDAEITVAAGNGIKFWAFVWYGSESSLRVAWNLYENSHLRDRINWCGIVATDALEARPFDKGNWRLIMQQWADRMAAPNYQKISVDGVKNRPLLYILWHKNDVADFFAGDVRNVAVALSFLRERVVAAGLGPPYVVVLGGVDGAQVVSTAGAQAISNYISGFRREPAGLYKDLDQQTRSYWAKLASTGAPVVPIAMVGWDTRPRHETAGPWYRAPTHPDQYYALATPDELAEHIRAAVRYIQDNPRACPSKVLLIYSWDECDEGGCLMPTHGDPTGSHLSAIARIIR
jgi:hypothetical protein